MGQAMNGETVWVGFFFQHKQQCLAPAIGPFGKQGYIQFPKAITQPLLQLFLAQRHNANGFVQSFRFLRTEQLDGLDGIVQNEVFEVLVVADWLAFVPWHFPLPRDEQLKTSSACPWSSNGDWACSHPCAFDFPLLQTLNAVQMNSCIFI